MMTDTDQNFFQVKSGETQPPKRRFYPFPDMEVGEHFDAPDDMGVMRGRSKRQAAVMSAGIKYIKKYNPDAKFTTRKLDGIIRCWRVA